MTDVSKDDLVLVTGAGGFIGGHLVGELRRLGHRRIRAVDVKPLDEWYQVSAEAENHVLDLRDRAACLQAAKGAREIYNLA
jgi:GDP-D-mannose 3', 5'-epimerase